MDGVIPSGEDPPNVTQPATETIGQRLRRLRFECGMSQRDLAVPGVSYAYISRIEAGTRQPSVKALRKLAAKLGVSPEYLETGSQISEHEQRELRLADAELRLRLNETPADVEHELEALIADARRAGDPAVVAGAHIALAFAASLHGRHEEAAARLEQAIEAYDVSVANRPDVYATLGRTYALLGEPERAIELFETCLRRLENEAPEDVPARARFATYLSYALSDSGALDEAQRVVSDAIDSAGRVADPITHARLQWSMARLSSMQGRQSTALRYARRAVALLEATENVLDLARAHVLCASIFALKDQLDEAALNLDVAERLFGANPDPRDLAYLRTEQAQVAAARGDGDGAVSYARESLDLLDDADPAEQGLARAALGRGLAAAGDGEGALPELERGFDLLVEHGRWRDARRCADTLAQALRSLGRDADAERVLERAETLGDEAAVAP